MEKIIYIFHRNTSLSETLAWTLQLGTDLKAVCLQDPLQLKTVVEQAGLVLTEPEFFEKILENSIGFSFPVLLIANNPEFDKTIEALYTGADDIVDPGNGPEEIIEKTNQLLHQLKTFHPKKLFHYQAINYYLFYKVQIVYLH